MIPPLVKLHITNQSVEDGRSKSSGPLLRLGWSDSTRKSRNSCTPFRLRHITRVLLPKFYCALQPRASLPTSTSWSHQPIMAGNTNAGTHWAAHHGLSCSHINISALGPPERKSRCDLSAPQPSFQYFSLAFITWQDNLVKSFILLTSQLTSNLCFYGLQRAKQHHFLNI